MKFYFTLFLFLCYRIVCAQSFWAYAAGSIKDDQSVDVCIDNSNNVISTGYFSGLTVFGPGFTFSPSSTGIPDIYIVKSNSSGGIVWAKKAGGFGIDKPASVAVDASGNIFITGFYFGNATFGATTLSSISGSQDAFIAKLDPSGNFLWAKSIGGSLTESANSITVDNTGNILITGSFQGTTNFGGSSLTSILNPVTSLSSSDVFIAKYANATGALIWVKQGAAKFEDKGIDIVTDNLDNVYVCGQFSDTIQFTAIHNNAVINAGFIIKLNSSGTEVWFKKVAAPFISLNSLAIDNSSNLFIAGEFQGTLAYFGSSISFVTGLYTNNALLLKIDNSGVFNWCKSEASTNYIAAKNVAIDSNQDPYIFGVFSCTLKEYSDAYGVGVFNSLGFNDFFITKYNNLGTRQWFKHYGSQLNDIASGLVMGGVNLPIMSGGYGRNLDIPTTLGGLSVISYSATSSSVSFFNQPNNYCGASGNYNQNYIINNNGLSDAFLFKGIDLTRNPFDYYTRTGTTCDLGFVKNCIGSFDLVGSCQDSLKFCSNGELFCNTNNNYFITPMLERGKFGPISHYSWNGSLTDTLPHYTAYATGYYTMNLTTIDGCYTSTDSIYVKINPLPSAPVVSDSYSVNILQPPATTPITTCSPATITLTGGNVGVGTTYHWTGSPMVSTHDSVAVVNSSGYYQFVVTDLNGCTNSNFVNVNLIPPAATIKPKQKNDTVSICSGVAGLHIICDSISNPALNYPYGHVTFTSMYYVSIGAGLTISPMYTFANNLCMNVNASTSGNYTYTIAYVINNPCLHDTIFFTGHIYIKVNPTPTASLNIAGSHYICPGDTSLLVATISSLSSTSLTYTILPNDTISATLSGNYYFYATVVNPSTGCSAYIFNNIVVDYPTTPTITSSPINKIICPSDSVKLTISLAGAPSYQWYGPSGLIPRNTQSIYVSMAGSYYCVVTDASGCVFITAITEIKNYSSPFLIASPSNIMCNYQPINLHVNTLDSSLIVWNAPLSGGGGTKVVTTPGVYSCQVTMCGITSTLSIVIIGANPDASITSVGTTSAVCYGTSIVLSGADSLVSYIWNPGGFTGQNLTVNSPGCYTLQVMDGYGCSKTSTAVCVNFLDSIAAPNSIINDTICPGQLATIYASTSSTNTIQWYSSVSGTTTIGTGTTLVLDSLLNDSLFYAASVSPNGCLSNFVPVSVLIHSIIEIPVLIGDSLVCLHDSIKIYGPQIYGASYSWSGPGISSAVSNSIVIANASFTNQGIYTLNITGIACTYSPTTINVMVPNSITVSPDTIACDQSLVTISCNSPYSNYLWSNGSTSSSIDISEGGTYVVSSTYKQCIISDTVLVSFISCADFDINVFTPNGDGSNDVFMFKSPAIKEVHCEIFNRWGLKMGEFDGPKNGWNGINMQNNMKCEDGTYYYIAEIKTMNNITKPWKGFLSLIR